MIKYIFLLGRPGCGKSYKYKLMIQKLKALDTKYKSFPRIDDYPILRELLDKDVEFKRHIRQDGGFSVTDFTIIDEVLQVINNRIQDQTTPEKLIFIEFARDNYQHALKNFEQKVFDNALIIYIKCDFEKCMKRNSERFQKAQKDKLDDHIVPPEFMKSYYINDDYEKILDTTPDKIGEIIPGKYYIFDNNQDDEKTVNMHVENIIRIINKTMNSANYAN